MGQKGPFLTHSGSELVRNGSKPMLKAYVSGQDQIRSGQDGSEWPKMAILTLLSGPGQTGSGPDPRYNVSGLELTYFWTGFGQDWSEMGQFQA